MQHVSGVALIDQGSEAALVSLAQRGNTRAFDLLVVRCKDAVRNFIRMRVTDADAADDLTQDTFLHAFLNITRFRMRSSFKTWLIAIAKNLIRSWARRRKLILVKRIERNEPGISGLDDYMVSCEEIDAVRRTLNGLPCRYRRPFEMREMEGRSYKEIALELHLPVTTVTNRIHTARRLFRDRICGLYPALAA